MRKLTYDDFLSRTLSPDSNGCCIWIGPTAGKGYGKFGRQWAHRWIYEYFYGAIPVGYHIHHKCEYKVCVNIDHLVVVTNYENNLASSTTLISKMLAKTHCPSGHAYDEENTYFWTDGSRYCRMCMRLSNRRSYRRRSGYKSIRS